jgi:hypothetical protein
MNAITYRSLLAHAAAALTEDDDPDGPAAQQALLLAAHAGIRRADGTGAADWDLCTATMTQAIADIQADLPDPPVVASGLSSPGPDSGELLRCVRRFAARCCRPLSSTTTPAEATKTMGSVCELRPTTATSHSPPQPTAYLAADAPPRPFISEE